MTRVRHAFWDPDGTRYGIPTYWWRGAPAGYATRRQLRAAGLRPGGQPVTAQILWRGVGGTRAAYLYRVDLARHKRTPTPAQLQAIDKALAARRTCPTCRQQRPYYIPRSRGECLDCSGKEKDKPMADLLTTALGHAARGWHVFPLRPGDKRPAVRDWEQRATTDPARIRRCWSAGPYGIGIACGPSGLVVLDLDVPKPGQHPPPEWTIDGVHDGGDVLAVLADRAAAPLPVDTYTVTTGSGGTHLYYQHPATGPQLRNTTGGLGWLVDTRAHGGYVVAVGTTITGRVYTARWDVDPAPLPGWLAQLLTPDPAPPAGPAVVQLPAGRRGAYLHAAITRQTDHITRAPAGRRNHALYLSAVALGQLAAAGELPEADVTAALTHAARAAGLTEREITRTIASGLRAAAARPRSLAA